MKTIELKGMFDGEIARRDGEPLNEWFERLVSVGTKQTKLADRNLAEYDVVLMKQNGYYVLGIVEWLDDFLYKVAKLELIELCKDLNYSENIKMPKYYVNVSEETSFFVVGKENKDYFRSERRARIQALLYSIRPIESVSFQRFDGETLVAYYDRLRGWVGTASNLVAGDKVVIKEAVFEWRYKKKAKYIGERVILGVIVKDSYGKERGQHSFMIEVIDAAGVQAPSAGDVIRRLGRNVYKNAIIIEEAADKEKKTEEKNARAENARKTKYWNWVQDVADGKEDKWWKLPYEFIQSNKDRIKELYPDVYEKFINKQ